MWDLRRRSARRFFCNPGLSLHVLSVHGGDDPEILGIPPIVQTHAQSIDAHIANLQGNRREMIIFIFYFI